MISADVLDEIPVVVAGEGELFEEPAAHDDPAAHDEPAPHDEPAAHDEPAVYEEQEAQEELAAPEEPEENVPGRPKPMFNDNNESSVGASQEPETNGNTPRRRMPPVVYGTPAIMSPPETYFGLRPGSLKTTFLGNVDGSSLVFQVLKIEKDESLKCFRARISDGSDYGEFILFYQNLSRRVQTLQECKFPFISITEYDILAGKYLAIADFKYLKSLDQVVGSPEILPPSFFASLQEGLKGLPNNNKMRGILDRNIPSSTRKRLPPAPGLDTPPTKRTRVGRLMYGL